MQDEGRQIVRESFRLFGASGELGGNRADLERAGRLFDSARLLNPDLSLLQDQSNQLYLLYRRRESVDRLSELVDREPENVEAWATLAQVAREVQPRLAARARAEARRLDPQRAERRR